MEAVATVLVAAVVAPEFVAAVAEAVLLAVVV